MRALPIMSFARCAVAAAAVRASTASASSSSPRATGAAAAAAASVAFVPPPVEGPFRRSKASASSSPCHLYSVLRSTSTFAPRLIPASSRAPSLDSRSRHRLSRAASALGLSDDPDAPHEGGETQFRQNDKIQVEVIRFGRLGASVDVIGIGHREEDCIGEDEPALGVGLVLQREIQYFRDGRGGLDVIVGEVLPAYVEGVRDDGRLHVSLRPAGGKAKSEDLGQRIMDTLNWSRGGMLPIGDKSTPAEINAEFPGTSKGAFKKAVAALYKKGLVQPGPKSITLMKKDGLGE